MRIDCSSGTSPRSRSSTMRSSASSACSKLSALMSSLAASWLIKSSLHQAANMGGDREGQPVQVVAAFQQADEPIPGPATGLVHQLSSRPVEIVLVEIDLGQRVAVVGVEAGRNDDEVRPETVDFRQDTRQKRIAEGVTA